MIVFSGMVVDGVVELLVVLEVLVVVEVLIKVVELIALLVRVFSVVEFKPLEGVFEVAKYIIAIITNIPIPIRSKFLFGLPFF